jgi:hypothetical protein
MFLDEMISQVINATSRRIFRLNPAIENPGKKIHSVLSTM